MELSLFPTELLSDITAYLHYLDVANLWFIGNSRLNAKLAQGGVENLKVFCCANFRAFRLPSLFFQLARLTRFALKDVRTQSYPLMTSAQLTNAPSTLKKLVLQCLGSFSAFHGLLIAHPNALPVLEALKIKIYDGEVTDRNVVMRWPRSLLKLELIAYYVRSLNLDLSLLPPRLESLNGEYCAIVNAEQCAFPATLTALRIFLSRLACDPVPLLPRGLTALRLDIRPSEDDDDEAETRTEDELKAWAKAQIALLPRGLLHLSWPLGHYEKADLEALPPTLVSLQQEDFSTDGICIEDFSLLPRTLESTSSYFHLQQPGMVTKQMASRLPPNFQSMVVHNGDVLAHWRPASRGSARIISDSAGLKKELKALRLDTLSSGIDALQLPSMRHFPLDSFPPLLTSLSINDGSLAEKHIVCLPNTLKVLKLAYGELQNVSAGIWKLLPRRLSVLHVGSVTCPLIPGDSLDLPRELVELSILRDSSKSIPLEWFDGLPKSLQSLCVPLNLIPASLAPLDAKSLDASSSHGGVASKTDTTSWRIQLPNTLRTLRISTRFPQNKGDNAIRNILASLPGDLEQLYIVEDGDYYGPPQKGRYSISDLSLLPKRLLQLYLPDCIEEDAEPFDAEKVALILPRSLFAATFGQRCLFREVCYETGVISEARWVSEWGD